MCTYLPWQTDDYDGSENDLSEGVTGEDEGSGGEEEDEPNSDDEEGVVPQDHLQSKDKESSSHTEYSFRLCPGVQFTLNRKDCNYLRSVCTSSGLVKTLPTDEEANRFFDGNDASAKTSEMSEEEFFSAVRRVLNWEELSRSDAILTMTFMKELYTTMSAVTEHLASMDKEGTARLRAVDLWNALLLLFKGTKSQKLTSAFIHATAGQETEGVDPADLRRIVASLLCPLSVVKYRESSEHAKDIAAAAAHVGAAAFKATKLEDKGEISFEQFGIFYNNGGHQEASWLELLDLNKWLNVSDL